MRSLKSSLAAVAAVVGTAIALVASAPGAEAAPLNGPPPGSQCGNNGEYIVQGGSISTSNGVHLDLQRDGNLVLYSGGRALWATGTRSGADAVIQGDGNFVLYNSANNAVWASNTSNNAGSYLCVQPDGNLVIYGGGWYPIWATNTRA